MIILPLLFAINLFYPIPELGYCQSKADCQAFCSFSVNQGACTNYGKKMGLIKEGAVLAQVTINYPVAELGNCASKQACKAYCNIPANYQACTSFAKSRGIIKTPTPSPTPAKGSDSKSLSNLKFPIAELGNCSSPSECKSYCDQSQNRQACFEFGRKTGLSGDQEAGSKLGGLQFPIAELGGCENFTACEAYCDSPSHRQACLNYAKAHGFEPPSDKKGPAGCTSDEECQKFCQANPSNEECAKGRDDYCKTNPGKCEKGPGGCQSDEECKKYCQENPNNQDCTKGREKYCKEHPDECKEQTGPGGCKTEEECKKYCSANPDKEECQKGRDEYCQKHPNECQNNQGGSGPQSGPGGCQSEGECLKYCQQPEHQVECQNQNKPEPTRIEPSRIKVITGPGGCSSPEECTQYCSNPEHQAECQKGGQPQTGSSISPPAPQ